MGIFLTTKKKFDFATWRLLLRNLPARAITHRLAELIQQDPQRAHQLLLKLVRGEPVAELGMLASHILPPFMNLVSEALGMSRSEMAQMLQDTSIKRTVFNTVLTLDKYGLQSPQRFYAPLMVVWNITYHCNLRCKHCYENAGPLRPGQLPTNELSREQKLAVVDELADSYVPTLSLSGGEPTIDPDFWAVCERAREQGLYLSMNTNGTLIDQDFARRLKELDFAYVAVSIDAPTPEMHDEFRGVPRAWEKAVQGLRNVVEAGVNGVLSFTMSKDTYKLLPQMFKFTEQLGCAKIMVFNFVPCGRGTENAKLIDLNPWQREEALEIIYDYAASASSGSVCATAPQLGRVCEMHQRADLVPLAHTGPGRAGNLPILAELIGGCGVGRAYCALQPEGTITPCVYMPQVAVGNITETRLLDIWHNHPLLAQLADRTHLQGHCGTCDYREVCGGCRARAYAYTGDFQAPDPGCINNVECWDEITAPFLVH